MPELPEVETTKNGLTPLIINKKITKVVLHRNKLRFEIPKNLSSILDGHTLRDITRRGKYLLFTFDIGIVIVHLGMSGSICVVDKNQPLKKHDHFEMQFGNKSMRLNDPRRFGCVLFSKNTKHKLLDNLGVEPLTNEFDNKYLFDKSRNKKQNIKAFIMDNKIVVGVGNIYACEALFQSKINPKNQAKDISSERYKILSKNIKTILQQAIQAGGTTLQDFTKVDGSAGYFSQKLNVYGRKNQTCVVCNGKIMRFIQNQRSSFYCPQCQK